MLSLFLALGSFMKASTNALSGWGHMPCKPGLYLSLSHGHDYPQQYVRQQGFAGPKLGPLHFVETQYAQSICIRFLSKREAKKFAPDATGVHLELDVVEGCLIFGGKCYGCWDVCYVDDDFCLGAHKDENGFVKRPTPESRVIQGNRR